jgi:hypothetical protein
MSLHQTDNEKERTAQPAPFLPFLFRPGRDDADVAVNRVPLDGEAPLTRGYLCPPWRPVNREIAILLRSYATSGKLGHNLSFLLRGSRVPYADHRLSR